MIYAVLRSQFEAALAAAPSPPTVSELNVLSCDHKFNFHNYYYHMIYINDNNNNFHNKQCCEAGLFFTGSSLFLFFLPACL